MIDDDELMSVWFEATKFADPAAAVAYLEQARPADPAAAVAYLEQARPFVEVFAVCRDGWMRKLCNVCARQHEPAWPHFSRRAARVELMLLVEIGALRNGRKLYMPEPEWQLIEEEIWRWACASLPLRADVEAVSTLHAMRLIRFRLLLRMDQQRIYDAILTGEPRPFVARELPTFAQIYRMGS